MSKADQNNEKSVAVIETPQEKERKKRLVKQLEELHKECYFNISTPELYSLFEIILEYCEDDFTSEEFLMPEQMQKLALAIKHFWNLKEIQIVYRKHGNLFSMADNMDYFFNHVESIMDKNYMPTEQEHLMARARTVGMCMCYVCMLYILRV